MSPSESPCLSLAIARLSASGAEHFAIWILQAPYPGGYVHRDCLWPSDLTQTWQAWQQLFSLADLPLSVTAQAPVVGAISTSSPTFPQLASSYPFGSYSSRLMQQLGLSLWQWLFADTLQSSFAGSNGIAIGQDKPLRLRLDIRDPELIALPWEIMQPKLGKPAIALDPQLRFSRTNSDVNPLSEGTTATGLKILLVLGQPAATETASPLALEQEAALLTEMLEKVAQEPAIADEPIPRAHCRVRSLLQPTAAELIAELETETYNIFFYAGHGFSAPDGGQLLLRSDTTLSGTELAQVLVRCHVTLAVFNSCWGAQPDRYHQTAIPRSSLAEVLIHHGVPAVLAMRDSIADREALSFIQAFSQALTQRLSIDRAVAIARQQLLTLYKFNQPAWTLPVLYMHPQFDGRLLDPLEQLITELPPTAMMAMANVMTTAYVREVEASGKRWLIRGGIMRVGRRLDNDLAIQERWVSQSHAEIFCREILRNGQPVLTYFLRDFSRYGTFVSVPEGWQKIHHQEVQLQSGTQLKFGSSQGQALEFVIENLPEKR